MVEINLTETEKKIFQKYNEKFLTTGWHLNDKILSEIKELKIEIDLILFNKVCKYVEKNQGILQKALYEGFFRENKSLLRSFFYFADNTGIVKRVKYGNSYRLYIEKKLTEEEFFEKWNKSMSEISKEPPYIQTETYQNSKEIIEEYFGSETLNEIIRVRGIGRNLDEYNKHKIVSSIGCCIKFDINQPLKEIIDRYWTKECNAKLREFLEKYGFFADSYFVRGPLKKIIGSDKLDIFYKKLKRDASTFTIKWCGYTWDTIRPYHIPWDYAQSLKFKWDMKPEIKIKECKYCGNEFIPSLRGMDIHMEKVVKYYPLDESINELNFCNNHFPPAFGVEVVPGVPCQETISKDKMSKLLRKLIDTLGFIPKTTFHKNFEYIKNLGKEKFEEVICILNDMPPYKKTSMYQPFGYKDVFGSWYAALKEAGLPEEKISRLKRNVKTPVKELHPETMDYYIYYEIDKKEWAYQKKFVGPYTENAAQGVLNNFIDEAEGKKPIRDSITTYVDESGKEWKEGGKIWEVIPYTLIHLIKAQAIVNGEKVDAKWIKSNWSEFCDNPVTFEGTIVKTYQNGKLKDSRNNIKLEDVRRGFCASPSTIKRGKDMDKRLEEAISKLSKEETEALIESLKKETKKSVRENDKRGLI